MDFVTTSGIGSRTWEGSVGVTAADNRLFVEAVLYRYRAGIPWRDLPERFGDWNNIHRRFSRWAKSGLWKQVFQHLAADADNEYAMIDSTIVRAHQHSAGAQKKTPQTKRSAARVADWTPGRTFRAPSREQFPPLPAASWRRGYRRRRSGDCRG